MPTHEPASNGEGVYGLCSVGEVLDEVEHVHVVGVQQAHVVYPTGLKHGDTVRVSERDRTKTTEKCERERERWRDRELW